MCFRSPPRGELALSYGGHATALIRYKNLGILCDPMLGEWCGWTRREVCAGLSPGELGIVDLILITHRSKDHLDLRTLARLPRSATIIVPPRTAQLVSHLGFARVIELAVDQSVEHRRVDIAATEVRHGSKRAPAQGYMIRGDGPSLFFCGASGYFGGFSEVGRRYSPDIALLPIGGYAPKDEGAENMSPLDALEAFSDLRSKLMIPIRHGTFALSYERLHHPKQWLRELVLERELDDYVVFLDAGESQTFVPPKSKKRLRAPDEPGANEFDVDLHTPVPEAPPAREEPEAPPAREEPETPAKEEPEGEAAREEPEGEDSEEREAAPVEAGARPARSTLPQFSADPAAPVTSSSSSETTDREELPAGQAVAQSEESAADDPTMATLGPSALSADSPQNDLTPFAEHPPEPQMASPGVEAGRAKL